jgi:hypothetical protein
VLRGKLLASSMKDFSSLSVSAWNSSSAPRLLSWTEPSWPISSRPTRP